MTRGLRGPATIIIPRLDTATRRRCGTTSIKFPLLLPPSSLRRLSFPLPLNLNRAISRIELTPFAMAQPISSFRSRDNHAARLISSETVILHYADEFIHYTI